MFEYIISGYLKLLRGTRFSNGDRANNTNASANTNTSSNTNTSADSEMIDEIRSIVKSHNPHPYVKDYIKAKESELSIDKIKYLCEKYPLENKHVDDLIDGFKNNKYKSQLIVEDVRCQDNVGPDGIKESLNDMGDSSVFKDTLNKYNRYTMGLEVCNTLRDFWGFTFRNEYMPVNVYITEGAFKNSCNVICDKRSGSCMGPKCHTS